MKKSIYIFACISIIFARTSVFAQAPGIDWKNVYSSYLGSGVCAKPTADGGYIVGGIFASHFLVFKLDNAGNEQWHRWIISGTGATQVSSVKQTADNGYIVAGSDFTGSTDSIGNHGIRDFMITKLDNSGNVAWIKCLGGTSSEEASSIEQTPDGGYIVAGYTFSSDGDLAGNTVPWYSEYWIVKLNASGNITWQKAMGGSNYDYATSVIPTSDGGYAVAGYSGSKDGNVAGTHWGGSDDDVWVVKLDTSGSIVWQKSYGGSKEDRAYSIQQTTDGGYIVAGSTVSNDGNVSGKHGVSHDNQDYWVIKLDASGNLTWQKCLGGSGSGIGAGSGNDIAYAVRQTTDGGYVVAGTVSSGAAVNDDISGYHGSTGSDYWVVKLDASGNIAWQKCLGGNGTEDARSIAETPDGGYIIAGTTIYSPDGDVNASDYSNNHPWIVKLGGVTGIQENEGSLSFAVYPNPVTEYVTVSNLPVGATLRMINMAGKIVYNAVIQYEQAIINTSEFSNGMYIVQVVNDGKVVSRKLVVNK